MTISNCKLAGVALATVAVLGLGSAAPAQHHHHYVNPSYHYHGGHYDHYHQGHYATDAHYHVYSTPIVYAARTHLDTLAADLKYAANRVTWDMYSNYTRSPGYRETYRETYKMLQDAKHIYDLIRDEQYHLHQHPGGVDHIATDLREIMALYQHIQQDIAAWTPTTYNPYHDAGLLHAKMQKFGELLNHIMMDYGIPAPVAAAPGAPGAPSALVDPPVPPGGLATPPTEVVVPSNGFQPAPAVGSPQPLPQPLPPAQVN